MNVAPSPGADVTSSSPVVSQIRALPRDFRDTETVRFTIQQNKRKVPMIGAYSTMPELNWAVVAQRSVDGLGRQLLVFLAIVGALLTLVVAQQVYFATAAKGRAFAAEYVLLHKAAARAHVERCAIAVGEADRVTVESEARRMPLDERDGRLLDSDALDHCVDTYF